MERICHDFFFRNNLEWFSGGSRNRRWTIYPNPGDQTFMRESGFDRSDRGIVDGRAWFKMQRPRRRGATPAQKVVPYVFNTDARDTKT